MTDILQPMLASLVDAPLDDPQLVYEPKYDGIRAMVEIAPRGGVRLWSRLGNEKTQQFPEIVAALTDWARRRKQPLVIDGEIVALDAKGDPTGFQQLQGRIHLTDGAAPAASDGRVAFIAFDIIRDGRTDYRERRLTERRAALEKLFAGAASPLLRISEQVRGDGRALYDLALERGWEGLIAKHADSVYKSGKRTPDWRKLKIVHEQEFVVGGWPEPRQTRSYFGALLLRGYEGAALTYIGHTGTGFNEKELARVMKLLKPLEIKNCPFKNKPKTNERPHWVRPELVAHIKFPEGTSDAKLRHPVYLGLRDDKKPADVVREPTPPIRGSKASGEKARGAPGRGAKVAGPTTSRAGRATIPTEHLLGQLTELEKSRRDGVLELPGGDRLNISNLHKVFWPKQKLTNGDLFRSYVRVARFLLPAVADRPLVMKRFPNGIAAAPFYQHRAPDVPAGVRTAVVSVVEQRPQIIGGDLKSLLYMTQIAAISQDPWFSRIQHPEFADYAALDLDPPDGVPFARVLDVARWLRDELDALGAIGVPKTSGSDGLHIYVPMPAGTPYDAGLIFCQIVAGGGGPKQPKGAAAQPAGGPRRQRRSTY